MRITACIATCNGLPWLPVQWQSMLQQTQPLHEIVVIDDASTDGSWQWWQQQSHPGLRLLQNETRLGARASFEKALALATGDLVLLADQDDEWLPEKVAVIAAFFDAHPAVDVVFTNAVLMDEQGTTLPDTLWQRVGAEGAAGPDDWLRWPLISGSMATGASMALRRTSLAQLLPLYTPQHYWHDYWLALLPAAAHTLGALPQPAMRYRLHARQQASLPPAHDAQVQLCRQAMAYQPGQPATPQLVAVLAHAFTRYQLFDAAIGSRLHDKRHWQAAGQWLQHQLSAAKTQWLRQLPWPARKRRLLQHWLHGGEYLRISWHDVWHI